MRTIYKTFLILTFTKYLAEHILLLYCFLRYCSYPILPYFIMYVISSMCFLIYHSIYTFFKRNGLFTCYIQEWLLKNLYLFSRVTDISQEKIKILFLVNLSLCFEVCYKQYIKLTKFVVVVVIFILLLLNLPLK